MTDATNERADAVKRNVRRSPNFPYIDLPTAIERVRELYAQDGRNATAIQVAAEHWNYSPTSSSIDKVVGALNAYGLVEVEGSGENKRIRLSERALEIVEDERPESSERNEALRAAALGPSIHRDFWEKYQASLPSDATLRTVLVREMDFNPKSVDTVIANYRNSIAHARLDTSQTVGNNRTNPSAIASGGKGSDSMVANNPSLTPPAIKDSLPLPVLMEDGSFQVIPIPRMSEQAFNFFKNQLDAYKAAIVRAPAVAPASDPE